MSDFSCYMTLNNNLPFILTQVSRPVSWGYWKVNPPSTISAFSSSGQFQLSDSTGPAGSEGSVNYSFKDSMGNTQKFQIYCDDPYGSTNNAASISNPDMNQYSVSYQCKSGDGDWNNNSCPKDGHPVYVNYYISDISMDSTLIDSLNAKATTPDSHVEL